MAIPISSQFTQRNYQWTDWKTVQFNKKLIYQSNDDGSIYTIWGYDGPDVHICTIFKGEVPYTVVEQGYSQTQNDNDKTDFENNYAGDSNKTLEHDLEHKFIYSAAAAFSLASSTTDFFTISGSSTKKIKIIRVCLSGTGSFSNTTNLLCIKRSTLNSGGTSSSVTAVPNDSLDPAATAIVKSYTANPSSLGTTVGNVRAIKYSFTPSNSETKSVTHLDIEFKNRPIILNDENESLCLNLSGATVWSASAAICIEWIEE